MEGVNIPPLYAEVMEHGNSTDKTPQGNPRDSGGSDSTYDHARVQSLGRILTDDDYDHLQWLPISGGPIPPHPLENKHYNIANNTF